MDSQISPQVCKVVPNEGMPIQQVLGMQGEDEYIVKISSAQEQKKGNLYIKFDIQFPSTFTQDTKRKLLEALEANEAALDQK